MDSNGEIHTGPVSVHEVEKSGLGGRKGRRRACCVWVCVVGKTTHKHKQIWFLKCCERVWLDDLSGGCKGTVGKEGGGGGGGARGGWGGGWDWERRRGSREAEKG